jgi:diadenosine tetraphosphate (Ap4A) HIT family hydrolase
VVWEVCFITLYINSIILGFAFNRVQDERYVAFNDRDPASEHHILVIPKSHTGVSRLHV